MSGARPSWATWAEKPARPMQGFRARRGGMVWWAELAERPSGPDGFSRLIQKRR
jgi:hypothetical protein